MTRLRDEVSCANMCLVPLAFCHFLLALICDLLNLTEAKAMEGGLTFSPAKIK